MFFVFNKVIILKLLFSNIILMNAIWLILFIFDFIIVQFVIIKSISFQLMT